MVTMDKYIKLVLAEMQMQEPPQGAVQSILDEPIPEAVKKAPDKTTAFKETPTFCQTSKEEGEKAEGHTGNRSKPSKNQISQEIPEGTSWSVQGRWPLIQSH